MSADPGQLVDAVRRYAVALDTQVLTGPGVCSGLGAWLLLALAAGGGRATDADLAELEQALGLPADEAVEALTRLLDDPHPAVSAAVARWADEQSLTGDLAEWSVPERVEDGPLPDQEGADRWASERTDGLIERFPVEITELTRLVLASALATRISWLSPLTELEDGGLGTEGGTARHTVIETQAAGPVAVITPRSTSGLAVLSVIADPQVPREQVLAAAHEIAARATGPLDGTEVTSDGHAWTLTEHREVRPSFREVVEEWTGWVPSWRLVSDHDLTGAPGFAAACAALEAFVLPAGRPADYEVRQSAVAAYTATGFEAAAVTGMAVRAAGMPPEQEVLVRRIHVRMDRPHAVVAVALADGSPWHGLPVFTAWVDPVGTR
ncbi:hypothetical protein SGUI_2022 [Serinicoccus hydrothermalis]|uniref:Serpin domain-containing protein n=1 Tax=Serinicoccus hydrothermalis TaxID=1758689 RepID=A0A1B1ND94_9MICO|nr:hypothetical protein [Serinicoccus hydrothermalis]ANS79418.1 hypothetical protein SGUI_2022 [Serinicoccus hydrothermalis]